ncbi:MAG: NifU family protein [Microthrixaceae bacterium]
MNPDIEDVIADVRPGIQADGGDVELVGVDESTGVVTVRLSGACVGCPSSTLTMKFGVERIMKDRVPWVTSVQQVEIDEHPDWAMS